jgi:hypothetical protein
MNSNDFRKMMTLLESIEQGRPTHQLDEIFGIFGRGDKQGQLADEIKKTEIILNSAIQAKELWEKLEGESQSAPIWLYFTTDQHTSPGVVSNIRRAAAIGKFNTFFGEYSFADTPYQQTDLRINLERWDNIAQPYDLEYGGNGFYYGNAVKLIQVYKCYNFNFPTSSILYKGKVIESGNYSGAGKTTFVHTPKATASGNLQDENWRDNPDSGHSFERIVDIVKQYCNWEDGHSIGSFPPEGVSLAPDGNGLDWGINHFSEKLDELRKQRR